MRPKVAIVYNQPLPCHYAAMGEGKAAFDVLDGVEAVHRALVELGYPVVQVPLLPPLEQARDKLQDLEADLVFNLFEGFDGCPEAEAAVAVILSELGLTYTGSSGTTLSLALDKMRAKELIKAANIDTPRCQLLSPETVSTFDLNYPCIVKPCGEDASHGISEENVVTAFDSLEQQVGRISELFGGKALVEEFVDGREFNVTVMGTRELEVLPVSEIVFSLPNEMPKILTFAAKWEPQSMYFQCTNVVCPANVDSGVQEHIAKTALAACRLFDCWDYARVDMRLNTEGRSQVIDVNPNPDISPDSGAARQARAAGMKYSQFIEKIVQLSLRRNGKEA